MENKKIILAIIIILLVTLMGLSLYFFVLQDKFAEAVEEPTTTTTTTTTTAAPRLKIVDPETKSRPFAIMINNVEGARKLQSGLQDAYIIYEMMVEGGITRYLALFLDQNTERIGSVRSARHYYLDYALENDAIYVHHGYSPQAKSDWSKLGVDRIEVSNSTGWRDKSLNTKYEYTLFTNIEKLQSGIKNKRTERNKDLLLNYSVYDIDLSEKEGAIEANKISIPYSNGTKNLYEYDAEHQVYKRFVNNKAQNDYVTGKQLTFKNIITYQVKYKTIAGDNKGRQDIENIGSGEGYYITNGYAVPIKWEKKDRKSQTKYTYENGEEIIVNDGNTFIQIQPNSKALTIE